MLNAHEPIAEFLSRQENFLAELVADLGEEEQQQCREWFETFCRDATAADSRMLEAVDRLSEKAQVDEAFREELVDAINAFERELLAAGRIFHALIESAIKRAAGVREVVQ